MSDDLAVLPQDDIAERLGTLVADTDIPLEQQTPWQRYELASFGDNRPTAVARAAAEKSARMALQQQLSDQISSSRAQARDDGYAEGCAQGYMAGHTEGLEHGRTAAAAEREQLLQLMQGFSSELSCANESIARALLSLALDIAKAMLKTALPVKPELVLPVIDDALRHLPAVQPPAILQLHPEDCSLVQAQIGDSLAASGWRLQPDTSLERGGCRIDTGTNQIDAELGMRWQRIAAALGDTPGWLE